MGIDTTAEFNTTLELEGKLTRKMANSPMMSLKRLVFAEMLVLCMSYRELLEPENSTEASDYEHF